MRTPPFYPDAVTLQRRVDADSLLTRLDGGAGCSVKDSFDALDLAAYGFRPLLRGSWFALAREPSPGWRSVDPAELADWERAWSGKEPAGFFLPSLLDGASIRVLARFEDGQIVAGAVANRAAGITGLTNVFGADAWAAAAACVDEPVVCWEKDPPPGAARLGDLTVWIR